MQDRTKKNSIRKRPYLGPSAKISRRKDVFHQLGIDPLQESLNPALLSHFVTDMGRVMGRAETQLTWRSQRRLSKAIRRAKMMGIIPLHSKKTRL
jgi:small subunit ribosomal protein S18